MNPNKARAYRAQKANLRIAILDLFKQKTVFEILSKTIETADLFLILNFSDFLLPPLRCVL